MSTQCGGDDGTTVTPNSTGFKLNKLYYLYNRPYPARVGTFADLPKAGWRLLVVFGSADHPMSGTQLADATGMVPMSVSRGVRKLVKLGFIEVAEQGAGRTATTYRITELGQATHAEISVAVTGLTMPMFQQLGPGGEERFNEMLDVLIEWLQTLEDT